MNINQWRKQGRFWQRRGQQIFVAEQGRGPALLLIHGFPTCSWDWHKVWAPLAKDFRLITLDLLGYGYSDKPLNHKYSVMEQADIIEVLLAELSVDRCHILSHDYGDTVAQELLARYHRHQLHHDIEIQRVVMLNGGLFSESHRPVLLQKLLLSPIGKWITPLISFKGFSNNMRRIAGHADALNEDELRVLWELIEYNNGRAIMPFMIRYINERKQYRERWVTALQSHAADLFFINGVEDPISGQHMLDRFIELVPEAQTHALAEVGHYPQLEAAEQILPLILDYIRAAE